MPRLLSSMLPALLGAAGLALSGCAADPAGDEAASDAPSALGSDAYRVYADLATEAGAAPTSGTVTVVGLRGLSIDGLAHATRYAHAFDDTFVVLRADGSVARFPGSTHPFELHGVPGVPDVNGDGAADVGMIRPGVYDVAGRDRTIAGQPSYAVTQRGSGKLPGWRDTDHDGVLGDDERAASEHRSDGLTDVLFHQGEGGAPAAVGCQVLPATAVRAFVTAIGGARAHFRYVLVDMTARDGSSLPR
jgi:hypothetical protein